eukprot:7107432-Pyramimonas_sp.AAC.1
MLRGRLERGVRVRVKAGIARPKKCLAFSANVTPKLLALLTSPAQRGARIELLLRRPRPTGCNRLDIWPDWGSCGGS